MNRLPECRQSHMVELPPGQLHHAGGGGELFPRRKRATLNINDCLGDRFFLRRKPGKVAMNSGAAEYGLFGSGICLIIPLPGTSLFWIWKVLPGVIPGQQHSLQQPEPERLALLHPVAAVLDIGQGRTRCAAVDELENTLRYSALRAPWLLVRNLRPVFKLRLRVPIAHRIVVHRSRNKWLRRAISMHIDIVNNQCGSGIDLSF
jgi:hypothetical protein